MGRYLRSMNCPNCSTETGPDHKFCYSCGQKTGFHRLSMTHIWHDVVHAFTHADKGIFYLLTALLNKPGIISKNYIEGQQKRYFNPFSFLILVVALSSFVVATFNLMSPSLKMANDPVAQFFNKHVNLVIFLTVPIIGFFTWLFFRKQYNFAEIMVLVAFTSGERSAFYTIAITPLIVLFRQYYLFIIGFYLLIYAIYYAIACAQFTGRSTFSVYLKGFLAVLFSQIVITLIVSGGVYVYYAFIAGGR